jgi:hypothetical protein
VREVPPLIGLNFSSKNVMLAKYVSTYVLVTVFRIYEEYSDRYSLARAWAFQGLQ